MANVYVRSLAGGAATGVDWANAYLTLDAAFAGGSAGNSFFVSEDHAQTQATTLTLTSPGTISNPCFIYCVNHAGTVPPVSADLRTTATISTTGVTAQVHTGCAYYYGITFNCGTSGTAASSIAASASSAFIYENCAINRNSGSAQNLFLGNTTGIAFVTWINTTIQVGSTSSSIADRSVTLKWKNTANAITGSIFPTNLFVANSAGGSISLDGVDLSALGSGKTIIGATAMPQYYFLKDCKLNASVVIGSTPTSPGMEITASRCDSTSNYRVEKYVYEGTQTTETVVIRTGGASDGITGISWKIVTTANSKWTLPFNAILTEIWNSTINANVGVTIEGIWNSASLPNNDQVWFDVGYLGSSTNPQASFATGSKADNLASGAALTASTQAWDSLAATRANLTAYNLGDIVKVSDNAGRIFFCTTAGTTAIAEVAGFAGAVDGGTVTDGTAVFRAGMRFKSTVTLSSPQPAQVGSLYVYVKAALASSTFYIDPSITLS